MKRVILCGLVAAGAAASTTALADDDTGAWYVAPMASYNLVDPDRGARNGFGFDVALGYNFAPHFAGEFNYSNFSLPIHHSASDKLAASTLDVLYKILPGGIVDPYAIIGGGAMNDIIGRGNGTNTGWTAEGGIGALTALGSQTGSFRMQLRTEAKYRREFIQNTIYNPNNPGDVLFNVGVQFEFGAPVPPAPKVVEVAPPPEPPPAPPPPPPPPPDSDHDGVIDSLDKCPNTPLGDKVDSVGCTIKDEIKLQGVNFATDSADLVPESNYVLSYAVDTLKKYPQMVIEVRGHTDNKGSKKHNLGLSQRRAESVMNYLKEHGVTNPMTAKGFGEENPIADNKTPEGRLENRRVSLRIVGGP
jgi:OOP family OmpA-OmpF porin